MALRPIDLKVISGGAPAAESVEGIEAHRVSGKTAKRAFSINSKPATDLSASRPVSADSRRFADSRELQLRRNVMDALLRYAFSSDEKPKG